MEEKKRGGGMQKYQYFCFGLFITLAAACQPHRPGVIDFHPQTRGKGVIYGEDNRLDLYQVQNQFHLTLADSTVALFEASMLSETSAGKIEIQGESLGEAYRLCEDEPFREQNSSAFCSGLLIAPDLILTAGHCVRSQNSCEDTRFVFGYGVFVRNEPPSLVPATEVYKCHKLVHSQMSSDGADFALVRLDRPVQKHRPLTMNENSQIQQGDPLLIIGHPAGLPTKISDGATVRRATEKSFFVANLDSYGGNSGSAVFNALNGKVEGILVRGDQDFVRRGNCNVSYRCTDEGCRGEDVTRMSEILPSLPGSGPEKPALASFLTSLMEFKKR